MQAAIDLGNTRGKIGFFKEGQLTHVAYFQELQDCLEKLKSYPVSNVAISNVGQMDPSFVNTLRAQYSIIELTHQTAIPIQNKYQSPQTLGMDRLAAVIGAWTLFQREACLVIDLGTCVTYDFINANGEYLGGAISPGLHMRAKAMHTFTAKLPLVQPNANTNFLGGSTESCLQSGSFHGLRLEIEGMISAYQKSFGLFNIVLCGGDAKVFESNLKASIFVRQEIVLIGLHAVLKHVLNGSSL